MSKAGDTNPADLIEAVHRLVGADQARAVQSALGGARIYLPKRDFERHWLTKLIGVPGMKAVVAEMGGELVIVNRESRSDRLRELIQMFSLAKLPVNLIALICDLSIRHIHSIRAALREQGELPARSSDERKRKVSR